MPALGRRWRVGLTVSARITAEPRLVGGWGTDDGDEAIAEALADVQERLERLLLDAHRLGLRLEAHVELVDARVDRVMVYELPRLSTPSRCNACGQPMWWAKTDANRPVPCDADGVAHASTCTARATTAA